jgi:hypothetical protein
LKFQEVIDALIFQLYFSNDFKEVGIDILESCLDEFEDIKKLDLGDKQEAVLKTYLRINEKKNPLRNQIKLMKIELKQLLNPILSV